MSIKAKTVVREENETTKINRKILGVSEEGSNADKLTAYIALKYYDKEYQCISEWDKSDLVGLSKTIDKINKMTWTQIYTDSGLRYKKIDNADGIPRNDIIKKISREIKFNELRVSDKARIVGFRIDSAFFVCWLDRNHEICGN